MIPLKPWHSFVTKRSSVDPLPLPVLLEALSPAAIHEIERRHREKDEALQLEYTVPHHQGFLDVTFVIFLHDRRWFYDATLQIPSASDLTSSDLYRRRRAQEQLEVLHWWRLDSFNYLCKHLGEQELERYEANCIHGKDGGVLGMRNKISESAMKHDIDTYVRYVFFQLIAPGDFDTRMRLVKELTTTRAGVLMPEEVLKHPARFAAQFEGFVRDYIGVVNTLRTHWQK